MNNSTRRKFLRNSSIAATGLVLATPSGAKITNNRRKAIACAPGSITQLFGTLTSVRSGNWSDGSTWGGRVPGAGDTPVISSGHTVTFDQATTTVGGVNVNSGGTLQFDSNKSVALLTTANIIIYGRLVMKPSSARVDHLIQFININENRFIGGGHDVIDGDVGLWVMGAGQLDLSGTRKKSWTRAQGSVNRGAGSFSVQDANAWNVGDTIFIVPTDMPAEGARNWNDSKRAVEDSFAIKFERRTITGISGNNVQLNSPLSYDHLNVSTDSGKTWTAEVGNITRNVRIEGTATGRSHIFIRSSMPQSIYYIAGRYLGPRKGSNRTSLVSGRYGLHFHHCLEGSRGSMVEGCAIFDTGNRAYVPHMSHGVTMNNNVALDVMEASFWWDFQEISHDTIWDGNLTANVSWNGLDNGTRGMELNMGDGNVARNNVVVYGHKGDEQNQGAYVWNADSEGVWIFENNLSHSNRSGLFVWQNTGNNHTIVNQESYNDFVGIFHGAYINSYTYTGGIFHNSVIRVKATSGNASGVRFEKIIFDGAGKLSALAEIHPSPVTSGYDYNAFRECTFKNYTDVAIRVNTFNISGENGRKHVSLIKSNFSGKQVGFSSQSVYGSKVYIQPASGECSEVSQSGIARVGAFAPYVYGTGNGLKGEYFNGGNHERLAFTRVDSMVMFGQWTYDKAASPTQVHYLITGNAYSMRWTGSLEAQYNETYTIKTRGSGGFRVWIDNQLVTDSWVDRASNDDVVTSRPLALKAGQKYAIKVEHMNLGGARACHLYWECPSLGRMVHIPQSQLYTDATTGGRPPVQNQVPVANAGEDIVITLPVTQAVLNGSQSGDPDGQIVSYNWSKISGPDSFTIASSDKVQTVVSGLAAGTYAFRLRVTDDKGAVHEDDVTVTVKAAAQAPVANAGVDSTITLPVNKVSLSASASTAPGGSITSYKWTKVSGPNNFNIANDTAINTDVTGLIQGVYSFRLKVTNDRGVAHEDDIVITVNAATPGNQSPVANAGQDVTVTLPQNSVTLDGRASRDPDGNITSYKWLMVNGPAAYSISNADSSVTSVINLAAGVYTFRLLVTDDKGATHTDDITVTVNPAASGGNQGSIANAGPDLFVTWPTNRTVLDGRASSVPGGSISRYRWSYVSGPTTYNISNNGAAETKLEDLREGIYVFRLTITDNKGANYSDDTTVTVSRNAAPQTPQNQAPVARAGQSMQITLPTNKVIVDGSGSSDADGFIASYQWSKVSGPSQFSIARSNSAATEINGLVQGVYVFRLTVTDDKGLTNAADISVNVLAAATQQPEPEPQQPEQPQQPGAFSVNVGADIRVVLPAKEITMSGVATGARVVSYRWSKVSGGNRYNIVSNSSPSTLLQDLSAGTFVFRLTATDDQGRQAYDDVTVTISNSLARTDLTPTLNAGVWPNPSSTNFNLNLVASSDAPISVKVHNQWGQTIRVINGVKNNSTIAVGGELAKGQYFLIAEQGDLKKIIKIIKL